MADIVKKSESGSVEKSAPSARILETLLGGGDLSGFTSAQVVEFYTRLCDELGLNPLTRPFQLVLLNGKKVLYPTKDCSDQLRKRDRISIEIISRQEIPGGVFEVVARAKLPDGRVDEASGSVGLVTWDTEEYQEPHPLKPDVMITKKRKVKHPLEGEALANARMKAETKAKRRVTLNIAGLGIGPDESEIGSIPGAVPLDTIDAQFFEGKKHESK